MHDKTKLQELAERARLYASVSSILRNDGDAELFRNAADELEKKKSAIGTGAVLELLESTAGRYAVMIQSAIEFADALRTLSLPAHENDYAIYYGDPITICGFAPSKEEAVIICRKLVATCPSLRYERLKVGRLRSKTVSHSAQENEQEAGE